MTLKSVFVRLENQMKLGKSDGMCLPLWVFNVRGRSGSSILADRPVKLNTEGDEIESRGSGS